MKSFSQFVTETKSLASIQARRLGLVPDGHGGYHDKKTGEFIAKNDSGRLKFYNQNQVLGSQDPPQVRTTFNQAPVSTQLKKTKKVSEEYDYIKELREKYISKQIFNVGDIVEDIKTGSIGKIMRRGTNYLICVTEDNSMFKSWIKDLVEYSEVKMDSEYREKGKPNTLVGTTGFLKHVAKMTPGATENNNLNGINFINKYKIKK